MKKKYGKFEKKPKVKDVLLQTYFTSLLCLVLCVTMFFGTSFAWFTSEVNVPQNEIYIGTLQAGLYHEDGSPNGVNLATPGSKLFKDDINWEPGYTALRTIRVQNDGDIAFKYVLTFTDGNVLGKKATTTAADGTTTTTYGSATLKLEQIAPMFEVYVYNHASGVSTQPDPVDYHEIASSPADWNYVGTLDQILNEGSVLSGEIQKDSNNDTYPAAYHTIALHMKEEATSAVSGHTLQLNVKLVAYQMDGEKDDLNSTYDSLTVVTDAEELIEALGTNGNVILANNIDLKDTGVEVPANVTVSLDLNGFTIKGEKEQTAAFSMIDNKGTLTIMDSSTERSGMITYKDIGTGGEYASNTICNHGVLNIKGGLIVNTTSEEVKKNGYPHAIDVYPGSFTNIYGGTIQSANYDAIRMFCNSETEATTVNIYGGNIINRVTFQNPGSTTNGKGVLNITGGTFTTTEGTIANIRLLNFSADYSAMKATITGGTFDKGVVIQNMTSATIEMNNWISCEGMTLTKSTNTDHKNNAIYTITVTE